jgi:hypothetical protein
MRDLRRHRVKHHYSLLLLAPITFDANTFSCYGGSYFATIAVIFCHFPKTSEFGRAINACIIVVAYYRDHCLLFRVCSFAELASTFIITAPKGATVVYTNTSVIFFQSYINTSMGHARLVCTQFSIFLHNSQKVGSYRFLFSPTDHSERSHSCSLLQQHS